MENNNQKIADLLLLEMQGKLTPAQRIELDNYTSSLKENGQVRQNLTDINYLASRLQEYQDAELTKAADWQKLTSRTTRNTQQTVHRVHFLKTAWFRYASAIIIIAGIGGYLWLGNQKTDDAPQISKTAVINTDTDIGPGKQGAILTLADGSSLVLDSLGNGLVADQGGAKVLLEKGRLAYGPSGINATSENVAYNTLVIPKGRQFQLMLPDGSKVWLNSASSLKYPVSFNGDTRTVEMTGEAYFEVAKNSRPFYVKVSNLEVMALGTGFNIMAYNDEDAIRTTLTEGSVKVIHAGTSVIIKPGQQASMAGNNGVFNITTPDLEQVLSWKNGQISFTSAALPVVMRQISRWYDIDIEYEGNIPAKHFNGIIDQNLHLRDVLKVLTIYGIHFRLEERKLTVLP